MVKLKTRMVMTDNLEDLERDEEYGRIVETRFGGYELQFPTKLNEEIKRFMGSKDFDMDVAKEGNGLRVILTQKSQNKSGKIQLKCLRKIFSKRSFEVKPKF